jgi:hypothetical protein
VSGARHRHPDWSAPESGTEGDRCSLASAEARGVKMGRPRLDFIQHQRREATRRRNRANDTLVGIARRHSVSPTTISRPAP